MTRGNMRVRAAAWAAAAAAIASPHARAYSTGDTFDLKLAGNSSGSAFGIMGHLQTGEIEGDARLWLGRADMQLQMSTTAFSTSVIRATTGSKHAGYGQPIGTTTTHALYWSGRDSSSMVNLHPAGFVRSEAYGAGGDQQVGLAAAGGGASPHAMLWTGTAASAIDLTPGSFGAAFDTDGVRQVGHRANHAVIWSGSPVGFVDLNPAGIMFSQALGMHGNTQVGTVTVGTSGQAARWDGTAASYVNMHPTGAGFSSSFALATNGRQHAGYAVKTVGNVKHAMVFINGGWIDLHASGYAPGSPTESVAESVDPYGNVAGHATYNGFEHPIVWYNGDMFIAGPNTYGWSTNFIWTSGIPTAGENVMITPANPITVTTTTINFTSPAPPNFSTLFVDNAGGGGAIAQLDDGGSLQTSFDVIGVVGQGSFVQTGGTHTTTQLTLGRDAGGVGQYHLSAGTLNVSGGAVTAGVTSVGLGGSALFNHTGGTHAMSQALRIGELAGGSGTYTLQDTAVVTAPTLTVGAVSPMDATGGQGVLNIAGGSMTIAGLAGVRDAAGNAINLSGGTLSVGSIFFNGNPARFNWIGGTLEITDSNPDVGPGATQLGAAVTLAASKTLRIRDDSQFVRVLSGGTLDFTGGKLDLTDKKLITSSHAAGSWDGSAYTGVAGLVDAGRGNAGNAQWDGVGIVTSDSRAIDNGDLVSVGVAKVGDFKMLADTATTTFAGQTVLGSDVVAMVTWGGDANLDGKINIDDYGRIDGNVGQSGSVFGWFNGDFNYDGKINIDDYGIIDGNINQQGAAFPVSGSAASDFGELASSELSAEDSRAVAAEGVAAVPEPVAGLLIGVAGVYYPLRRGRRWRARK